MTLQIAIPREDEASHLSGIHLRAMDSNALLHAQFPTLASIVDLENWLDVDTLLHIRLNARGILVARDSVTGEPASFIKWVVRRRATRGGAVNGTAVGLGLGLGAGVGSADDESIGEDEPWPKTANLEYLDPYSELTSKVRGRVMGDQSYYHVLFLCTDPKHGGRGGASMLLREILRRAEAEGLPVVLESTMTAVSFYERLSFRLAEGLEMLLPVKGSKQATELYQERCMVWTPKLTNGV